MLVASVCSLVTMRIPFQLSNDYGNSVHESKYTILMSSITTTKPIASQ